MSGLSRRVGFPPAFYLEENLVLLVTFSKSCSDLMTCCTDGLVWGASTLVAVGFGIKKLQINLVVEDDKISLDELQQEIEGDEDHVQSTDVSTILCSQIFHSILIC